MSQERDFEERKDGTLTIPPPKQPQPQPEK